MKQKQLSSGETSTSRWPACSKDSAAGIAVRLKGGTLAVSKMLRVKLTKILLTLVFIDCSSIDMV